VAEEALAIAIYCALSYPNNFRKSVLLTINHSSDSGNTGAITGNILGALLGTRNIPTSWIKHIELKTSLEQTAKELFLGHHFK